MTDKINGNGWSKYEMYVLRELRRLNASIDKTEKSIEEAEKLREARAVAHQKTHDDILRELSGLKVKSGIWGLVAGSIPVITAWLYHSIK